MKARCYYVSLLPHVTLSYPPPHTQPQLQGVNHGSGEAATAWSEHQRQQTHGDHRQRRSGSSLFSTIHRRSKTKVSAFQVFSEGRATRSSKKVEQWTEIPLLAKLLKLLVNEMQNCVEEAENGAEDSSDEEDGWDDDSQDSQEEEGGGAALNLDLSRLEADDVIAFLKTTHCKSFRLLANGGGAHDSTRSLFDVEEEVGIQLLCIGSG